MCAACHALRIAALALALLIGACGPSSTQGTATTHAAPFDYWVLALSWSPEYCGSDAARPDSRQCAQPREFIVHGLWPQYERGYPHSCPTQARVGEHTIEALREWMPDRGLVIHQWRKHGSCSGLSTEAYFAQVQRAAQRIVVPRAALRAASAQDTAPGVLEQAFIDANPGLRADALVLDCRKSYLREVRICLDLNLEPRACGPDLRERCGKRLRVRGPS